MIRPLIHTLCAAALFFGAAVAFSGSSAAEQPAAPAEQPLSPELSKVFEEYVALPSALVPILESVQDYDSAEAAAPKLHEQLDRIYRAQESMSAITSLSAAESAAVQARYAAPMRREWGRVFEQIFRLRRTQCYHAPAFTSEFGYMNMMLAQ